MHKIVAKVIAVVMVAMAIFVPVTTMSLISVPAYADEQDGVTFAVVATPEDLGGGGGGEAGGGSGGGGTTTKTSILPENWGIADVLKLILNIVLYGLGAAAVLGVVLAGITYMTARDNEAQVAKAKTRLFEVVIGLVAWAVLFAVLNWIIPGGVSI